MAYPGFEPVACFPTGAEAEVVRGLLAASGLDARVVGTGHLLREHIPTGELAVLVPVAEVGRAREIIASARVADEPGAAGRPSRPVRSPSRFDVLPFAAERRAITAALGVGARRHMVHALLEIDVTRARQLIRERAAETGERLSFTAFVVACVARAIDRNRLLHAYRDWRGRLVLFDDVDAVALVESEVDHVAVPHVLRAANRKTVREIHHEIRRVQSEPSTSEQRSGRLMRLSRRAPRFAIGLFLRAVRRSPQWLKRTSGTTLVTSIGMFGSGFGWGIGLVPLHTLAVTIGAIAQRPGVVDGRVELREHLALTLSVDHDIVDGAPAARFAAELRALLERGDGLES